MADGRQAGAAPASARGGGLSSCHQEQLAETILTDSTLKVGRGFFSVAMSPLVVSATSRCCHSSR